MELHFALDSYCFKKLRESLIFEKMSLENHVLKSTNEPNITYSKSTCLLEMVLKRSFRSFTNISDNLLFFELFMTNFKRVRKTTWNVQQELPMTSGTVFFIVSALKKKRYKFSKILKFLNWRKLFTWCHDYRECQSLLVLGSR